MSDDADWCDFEALVRITSEQFACGSHSVHGPGHWARVERNGLWLASRSGADPLVVCLFAWFHDSRRVNDHTDPDHGRRGAEFAASQRDVLYRIDDERFALLIEAATWHTDRTHDADPTVGTCFDADRLDLGRVGITPSPAFLNTTFGVEVATAGSFEFYADELKDIRRLTVTSQSSG